MLAIVHLSDSPVVGLISTLMSTVENDKLMEAMGKIMYTDVADYQLENKLLTEKDDIISLIFRDMRNQHLEINQLHFMNQIRERMRQIKQINPTPNAPGTKNMLNLFEIFCVQDFGTSQLKSEIHRTQTMDS